MHFKNLVFICLFLTSTQALAQYAQGQYLVQFKNADSLKTAELARLSVEFKGNFEVMVRTENIALLIERPAQDAAMTLQKLRSHAEVEFAELNYKYYANAIPDDPEFPIQWGLQNIGQFDDYGQGGVGGVDINALLAWDVNTGSEQIKVAVLDSGANYNLSDLKPNMWVNEDEAKGAKGVDEDNNGYNDDIHGMDFSDKVNRTNPMDTDGHGTHIAGIIGAAGNNNLGFTGVAWKTRIVPIKFIGPNFGSLDGALRGFYYAMKVGAKVINCSWSGQGESVLLKKAIEKAGTMGILVITAAGNDSDNLKATPVYPAAYNLPNMVVVGAVDNRGIITSMSNYGKQSVHVVAPGQQVLGLGLSDGEQVAKSGTSVASAHVSGVAALMFSHDVNLTPEQAKERIIKTAKPLEGARYSIMSKGIVDAYAALMNIVPPIDLNVPENWASTRVLVSSPHPYAENARMQYVVHVPGAKELSLYFERFETENTYDKLIFYDKDGKKVGSMSGSRDEYYSPIVKGDTIKMVFVSDGAENKYGFRSTKVSYR